jgi:hypothetical protein
MRASLLSELGRRSRLTALKLSKMMRAFPHVNTKYFELFVIVLFELSVLVHFEPSRPTLDVFGDQSPAGR